MGAVALASLWVGTASPMTQFPFRNRSLADDARVKDLVGRLTLHEKVQQMSRGGAASNTPSPAIARLGIAPHVWGTECASGLGSDDGSFAGTSFPQPLGLAAAWDPHLVWEVANATAVEVRAQHNMDMANGVVGQYHHGLDCWSPVINIMRHWAWGRNDETYGECPILSGRLASSFVRGLQGGDARYVAASVGCKHFVVHGGPDTVRRTFSANVTLRDWATTFMPQFEACVRAGGLGMMCAFNSIRGVPACANHRAMSTWARERWGFEGYMVSDQGAAYGIMADHKYADTLPEAAAAAVSAGLDLEDANDPAHTAFSGLVAAVEAGLLDEGQIDAAVSRLFFVRLKLGEFDDPALVPYRSIRPDAIRSEKHLGLTRRAAASTFVLLENRNGTLPFSASPRSIAVVGPFADCAACYFGKYSPHLDVGHTVTVAAGLTAAGHAVHVASGCSQNHDGPEPYMCDHYNASAVAAAIASADVVVVAVGLGSNVESEGRDRARAGLALPGPQNALVSDALAAASARRLPAVALLFVAGPVDPALFDTASAVIDVFYPAEATGSAITDTLFGKAVPAGRLPFSWPTTATDSPPEADYTMVNRTYRYGQPNVRWPFGFGLSYGRFEYGQAALAPTVLHASALGSVRITLTVANVGDVDADEVVQAYVRWTDVEPRTPTPVLSLADFQRITVAAHTTEAVSLALRPREMAVLTEPSCATVPPTADTKLGVPPLAEPAPAPSAEACCARCAHLEACEAFTFDRGECSLVRHWANATRAPGAISGEPLSQWVLRPSVLEVLVGPNSVAARPIGTVRIVGTAPVG